MGKKELKHSVAWDSVEKKWVRVEEVPRIAMHDPYRYFSEQEEYEGDVLTVVKECEVTRKSGKKHKVRGHFRSIGQNSKAYASIIEKKKKAQESLVHKTAKEVARNLEYIHIPELRVGMLGIDVQLACEQYVPVKYVASEKRDTDTNKIPDITMEMKMLGVKQQLFIEIVYKNEVSAAKRDTYTLNKKNCLAVDISDLQCGLSMSEGRLEHIIRDRIEHEAYWVSSRFKQLVLEDIIPKHILEISYRKGLLRQSKYSKQSGDFGKDFYMFKDELTIRGKLDDKHPCYTDISKIEKGRESLVNIEECRNCKRCLSLRGWGSLYKEEVKIYCSKLTDIEYPSGILEMMERIISEAKELLADGED